YDGATQVWRVGVDGGDLQAVTRIEKGVSGFDLAQDGSAVYYTVAAEDADEDWKELRGKYKEFIEYGRGVRGVSEVWELDLTTWRSERLLSGTRRIRDFAVSPDQKRIAMLTTPDARLISNEGWSRLDIYDATTKEVTSPPDKLWRADAPSPYGWLENLAW